ncbi:MAG: efflux RND transporter permease subunit [Shewanella fodinae]|nr:efflux RND transporter permease subunit [Shewanella fodinae]
MDRTRAASLGITVKDIDDALYAAFGQSQISTLYTDLSQYHVVLSASIHTADVKQMVNQLHIASSDGVPVPLASVVTIKQGQAPLMLFRQGQFPYADIGFNLAPGYSLGDAISAINQMKKQLALPAAVQLHFEGAAEDMAASTSSQLTLMCAAIIVVYLMLGMLYESFIHPLTILSTLPSAALGALLALGLSGKQFDVISLIGIVLLIGIVMKNAIMMIDFAIALERERHLSPQQAIKQAYQQRFRPILMTTLAALLGAVPLAFGSGIGSELRQPLGIAIIGGLLVSQLLTLFSTPVFYLWLHRAEVALARRI